jgi:hypothetical protein
MDKKQRQYKRHRVRECLLSYRGSGLSALIDSFKLIKTMPVSDVSQSGLSFISDKSFEAKTLLNISLDIPAFVKPLKLEAEVMWCQKVEGYENYFKIGVLFTKMKKEDRSRLNRLDHDSMLHHVRRDPKDFPQDDKE